jgi:carbamoyltransferase
MKHILGVSAGFHDGAIAVVDGQGDIVFAAHSERFSKLKNDAGISPDMLRDIKDYDIHTVAFYERPWLHNVQQLISGQNNLTAWTLRGRLRELLPPGWLNKHSPVLVNYPHHLSHAAAAFQTSSFDSAAVVVIDAIGELDTISIYHASYDQNGRAQYRRVWRHLYPHSVGLFYSAVTKHIGLKPMEDEYVTMGMSAYASHKKYIVAQQMEQQLIEDAATATFLRNLHIGLDPNEYPYDPEDMAGAVQTLTQQMVHSIALLARSLTGESNLCYGGGVALNCVANHQLGYMFDKLWIMPNPGDAGASLGAAALSYGQRLNWKDAYLGHFINGDYPVKTLLDELIKNQIVGVASGHAEFGPRALGNRSLLADPRGSDIKDRVNAIKQRQKFRPFAPVILEEVAEEYFNFSPGWRISRYMQSVAECRYPDRFPAICHVDGTSRVQTVPADGSGIRQLLEQWYLLTGCPMLLNTSLNIRGKPMVNDRYDAREFSQLYGVRVCT